MGIREQGYRHWEGTYTSHTLRWWTITLQALRATTFNKTRLTILLLMAFVVWAPYLFFGIFFFLAPQQFGQGFTLTTDSFVRRFLFDLVQGWEFFAPPIFIATVAAPLVATDLRSNALYIYLSKPLRRLDYILGKAMAVLIFSFFVTILPTLFVLLMSIAASNKTSPIQEPWEILFEILGVQVLHLAFFASATLVLSSVTKQWWTSFIGFLGGYYGLWIVQKILVVNTDRDEWALISPVNNLRQVSQKLLEQTITKPDWGFSLLIISAMTIACFAFFAWRISKIEVAE